MQRHLRGFTHRADEQKNTNDRHQRPFGARQHGNGLACDGRRLREYRGVIQAAGGGHDRRDAQYKAEVADPVNQKRLQVRADRALARVPETDQQVRHQPHRFPAEKQLQKIVAHHQHQHGEGKERDVAEKALITGIVVHVADGVHMHHQRHEGDDRHHQHGQIVDEKADLETDAVRDHPGVDRFVIRRRAVDGVLPERPQRQQERQSDSAGRYRMRTGPADAHSVTTGAVGLSFLLSLWAFWQHAINGAPPYNESVYTWMVSDGIRFEIGFLIDNLTVLMMTVVTFVSLMVHVYTIGYMHDDPGYQRFFSYISLFTFAMLMLVMSNNFLQLFFGWEAVGLVSYLLIGFWYTRESAIRANLKAFLVNRVGDFGFVLGIAT